MLLPVEKASDGKERRISMKCLKRKEEKVILQVKEREHRWQPETQRDHGCKLFRIDNHD